MTGLDLESFLLLLRADLTTWMVLGLATLGLAVLVWSSWRSRRALRNCLVLSLAAHLGLVLYGSTIPAVMWTVGQVRRDAHDRSHIRQIRVAPLRESKTSAGGTQVAESSQVRQAAERWDVASAPLKLADASLKAVRPKGNELSVPIREPEITSPPLPPAASSVPEEKIRGNPSSNPVPSWCRTKSKARRRNLAPRLPRWLKSTRLTSRVRLQPSSERKLAEKSCANRL